MSNHLMANSQSYYSESHIYALFSQAEDKKDYIFQYLEHELSGKTILDLGCGNGKYSGKLSLLAKSVYALDLSFPQLCHLSLEQNIFPLCASATNIPLAKHSVQAVLCCWMLGTVPTLAEQERVIQEIKRVLKPDGVCYMVENDMGSEFESLRGRYPDCSKTEHYNHWLERQGFDIVKKIQTHFEFENSSVAHHVFSSIWKERLTRKITQPTIEHKVLIFKASREKLNVSV